MTGSTPSLDQLRQEIDQIDDRLHDLLMDRCALVERIGGLKSDDGIALRPGREAEILRRLAARHRGTFPVQALVRIWREVMGTLAGVRTPFTLAVAQPDVPVSFVEVARNHFGVVCPFTLNSSPGQVVKIVADGRAGAGVVPLPGRSTAGGEPWWVALIAQGPNIPQVVTRLPILQPETPSARADIAEALVIAKCPREATGSDRTLLVVETAPSVSRDRVRAVLTEGGFEPLETFDVQNVGGTLLHLVEVNGWCDGKDSRLAHPRDPVAHIGVIGGYPVPLTF